MLMKISYAFEKSDNGQVQKIEKAEAKSFAGND
jgi:hypothetical protein